MRNIIYSIAYTVSLKVSHFISTLIGIKENYMVKPAASSKYSTQFRSKKLQLNQRIKSQSIQQRSSKKSVDAIGSLFRQAKEDVKTKDMSKIDQTDSELNPQLKNKQSQVKKIKKVKSQGFKLTPSSLAEQLLQHNVTTEGQAARKVANGLKVYTEEELGIGKGGFTKRCPFDCDCCF